MAGSLSPTVVKTQRESFCFGHTHMHTHINVHTHTNAHRNSSGLTSARVLNWAVVVPMAVELTRGSFKVRSYARQSGTESGELTCARSNGTAQANRLWTVDALPLKICYHRLLVLSESADDESVMLDIGSNVGSFSLLAYNLTHLRVLSFEPTPVVCGMNQYIMQLNNLSDRVTTMCAAAAAQAGEAEFFFAGMAASGESSVHKLRAGIWGGLGRNDELRTEPFTVPVTTVDMEVRSRQLRRVHFIKVDTEGHDMNVLLGAHETLATHTPDLIIEALKSDFAELREDVRLTSSLSQYVCSAIRADLPTDFEFERSTHANIANTTFEVSGNIFCTTDAKWARRASSLHCSAASEGTSTNLWFEGFWNALSGALLECSSVPAFLSPSSANSSIND